MFVEIAVQDLTHGACLETLSIMEKKRERE